MEIEIELETEVFARIEERMKDFSIPLNQFGEHWKNDLVPDQFKKQQTADDIPWKALFPGYEAWKIKNDYPRDIGKLTTETYKSRDFDLEGNAIRLSYNTTQAEFFDRQRPLFSRGSNIPDNYSESLEKFIIDYLNS